MKKKFIAIALVTVMMLSSLVSITGCTEKYPLKKGAEVEQTIKMDQVATIGKTQNTGWALEIPKATFKSDVKLTMNVLSSDNAKDYEKGDFTFLGTPVEIKLEGKKNVRLGEPVKVKLQIPKEKLKNLAQEELFFGYFYNNKWEYYIPDSIDLEKGVANFTIYHFSFLGFGKPSEKDQIETYAKNIATNEWEKETRQKQYLTATKKQFDDLFSHMGVENKAARNQLMSDVVSYLDDSDVGYFDFMAQSVNTGVKGGDGKLEFENKYKEFLGKALYQTIQKKPEKFAEKVNVIGNLASAAGSLAGGDSKAAMQSIANMLNGAVPLSQLATSTSEYIATKVDETIDYWAKSEIEKAYQVYKTGVGGKWGYEDGLKGDFDTIFTLLGGGERQMDIKIIRKHCEMKGLNESKLTESQRSKILADARKELKKSFDKRIVDEPQIDKRKQKEESFIAALKAKGLLSANNNQKYFGIEKNGNNFNITDRLNRLYERKAAILSMMDKDQAAKISDENLVKAIDQWIFWSQKGDKDSFFKYMRDMGYIKEPIPTKGDFAWVLVGTKNYEEKEGMNLTNKDGIYSVEASISPGSYYFKKAYLGKTDNYYNPPVKTGEALAVQSNWSTPPSQFVGGEKIELTVSISAASNTQSYYSFSASTVAYFDKFDMTPGFASGGATDFKNANGKYSFSVEKKTGYASVIDKVSAIAPSGKTAGDKISLVIGFYMGHRQGTVYVYEWKEQ